MRLSSCFFSSTRCLLKEHMKPIHTIRIYTLAIIGLFPTPLSFVPLFELTRRFTYVHSSFRLNLHTYLILAVFFELSYLHVVDTSFIYLTFIPNLPFLTFPLSSLDSIHLHHTDYLLLHVT
ncbi:hypothetical protein GGR50DRAFT_160109 [Xylaria sp. CBS 124048]|nr:hypothetical protein GGR50DRAFT_160109 [Xylaria sp. CBS 124048]